MDALNRAHKAEAEREKLLAIILAIRAAAGNPERVYQLTRDALTKYQPLDSTQEQPI